MRIDLNADVGEIEGDSALLDFVTSANVCSGAYAGDDDLIRRTCAAAAERGVTIGAQVGYPDRPNFGRAPHDPPTATLVAELRRQLDHLAHLADGVGARVEYLKAHGALYNRIVDDVRQAAAVVATALPYGLPLLGLPQAASLWLAEADGLSTVTEGFADRAYRADGTLVPRGEPGALIEDPQAAAAQALALAPTVGSICVHGDTPGAATLVAAVRRALEDHDVRVLGFLR